MSVKEDFKNIDDLIDDLATDVQQFRKDMNSHLLPPFFGLKKSLNPHFNGTYTLFKYMEQQRKRLSKELISEGIKWPKYEKYTLFLYAYFKNPVDSINRDYKIKFFLWGLSQFEGRYYARFMDRYLGGAKSELDRLKLAHKSIENEMYLR